MRNAIVFINICIVIGVTMMLLDFDSKSDSPAPAGDALAGVVDLEKGSRDESVFVSRTDISSGIRTAARDVTANHAEPEKETQFVLNFLGEMQQVRMLEFEMAALASQRATSRELKDYGNWMLVHQKEMLGTLKAISASRGITGEVNLNEQFSNELAALSNLHGKKFDARYIKVMNAEYKRDLKRLEQAAYSSDADIKVFAARYESITKDNLAKIQRIRKSKARIF